jgi:hypothetical protein
MQHTTPSTPAGRYPVLWRDGDGPVNAGRLEVGDVALRLVGTSAGKRLRCVVPWSQIRDVRIGQMPHERLQGLRSVIVERVGAAPLAITDAAGVGAMLELADLLSRAAGTA